MCGILGWWRPPVDAGFDRFHEALALQRHRGPNAEQAQDLGPIWLGHNRLAILDLSERGTQPMTDSSGRYTIVYNGEVYNYLELKRELEARHGARFETGTDTEVVLAAFRHWGMDAFGRLNGMWSLAIWDSAAQRLTLCRDRFGIKPMYYSKTAGGFCFASEIKPLLHLANRTPVPRIGAIARFFAAGNVDGFEETWFDGISRFPAGKALTIDLNGDERWHEYWRLEHRRECSFAEREEAFDTLLSDAVKLTLRSDVPVGICLSGGIDSSTLACIASENQRIRSYTSRHADSQSDEFAWVREVAQGRAIDTQEANADTIDIAADSARILWHLEEPAKATGVLSQWNVMRRAKGEVVVLLDGQGGDEVFAGYAFHRWPHLKSLAMAGRGRDFMAAAGAWGWSNALNAALAGPQQGMRNMARPILRPLRTALRGDGDNPWADSFFTGEFLPALARKPQVPGLGRLHERLSWDIGFEMLPALLRYEDKVSMAFSLESRVPLLDHRLVSFAFSLGAEDLVHDGWTKWPLRRALDRRGAAAVAWRRDKMGFPTPMNDYWRSKQDRVVDWISGGSLARHGIIDRDRIVGVLKANLAQSHGRLAWHLLQTEWWFRTFIDGDYRECPVWA